MKALALALALLPRAAAPAGVERGRHQRRAELSVTVRVVRSTVIRPAALELARARAAAGAVTAFGGAGEPLSVRVVEEGLAAGSGGVRWVYVFPDSAPRGSPPGTLRAAPEHRETAERVHGCFADSCPLYRSLKSAVAITTELTFLPP